MDSKEQKDKAQNRLLLFSAILAFLYYAEAKFEGITAIGTRIVFQKEDAVLEFIWVIWAYFYARSYQYYKESGIDAFRKALNDAYVHEIGHLLLRIKPHEFALLPGDDPIKSSVLRLRFGAFGRRDRERLEEALPASIKAKRAVGWLRYERKFRDGREPVRINLLRFHTPNVGGVRRIVRNLRRSLRFRLALWAVVYPPTSRFDQQGQHKYFVYLPNSAVFRIMAVYFRTILLRPQFTENQIPLIAGLVPVWYLIYLNRAQLTDLLRGIV